MSTGLDEEGEQKESTEHVDSKFSAIISYVFICRRTNMYIVRE